MACSCVCFRSEPAMGRLTISVRNKTVMTRALKTTMWSAELICGELLLDMRRPICMITVVLKQQFCRLEECSVMTWRRCVLPSCQQWVLVRHALCFIRFVWLLYWFVFWNFNMVALLFHRLQDVLDSYDSSAKDDSCLPSCQQFAVSTCWRHALAFIRFVWLLYWFVFWNFNMVALLFHRLEDVLDKTR